MKRPVVITGMGIWSCIGQSVQEVEQSLRLARSGIGIDSRRTAYGYQSPLTGIVPVPDLQREGLRRSQRTCMGEPTDYAYMAVSQAFQQAPIPDRQRCALIVSNDSTAAALAHTEAVMQTTHDSRHLSAGVVFRSLNSTVSMNLATIFNIGGLSLTVSAACAGGGHAIGLAHLLIANHIVDCCVVVGAQEVGLHAFTSFDALGIFSRRTDNPAAASRPFDNLRDGLVPSGGAACVIMESADHAAMGGRRALARVAGYGFFTSQSIITPSSDAYLRSMSAALTDAGITAADLSLIMAHATSTRDGDTAEANALSTLLTGSATASPVQYAAVSPQPPFVVSTKALTGHECWMSGVSQVVYALIQMQGRFVTPHPNLSDSDKSASRLRIPTTLQEDVPLPHVLCNAFGFGGTCASLVLSAR